MLHRFHLLWICWCRCSIPKKLPFGKLTYSDGKWSIGRCISYWKWGYSIAMLVYQKVIRETWEFLRAGLPLIFFGGRHDDLTIFLQGGCFFVKFEFWKSIPLGSMYGIFTYIHFFNINQMNNHTWILWEWYYVCVVFGFFWGVEPSLLEDSPFFFKWPSYKDRTLIENEATG